MRSSLLLPCLGFFSSLSLAEAKSTDDTYADYCPEYETPDDPKKVLADGRTLEWKCEVSDTGNVFDTLSGIDDPLECAKACQEDKAGRCLFSIWLSGSSMCQLFDSEGSPEDQSFGALRMVLSKASSPSTPQDDPETDCKAIENSLKVITSRFQKCQSDLKACKNGQTGAAPGGPDYQKWYNECRADEQTLIQEKDKVEKDLATCLADKQSLADGSKNLDDLLQTCTNEKHDLQDQLDTCTANSQEVDTDIRLSDMALCPGIAGKPRKVGGLDYITYCGQGVASGSTRLPPVDAEDFTSCLTACSSDRKCQMVNFWFTEKTNPCVHFSNWDKTPTVRNGNMYMSAILTKKK